MQHYKQNPLEKFIIFTIYQNYTLALICANYVFYHFIIHLVGYE